MKNSKIKKISNTALFTAIIATTAWISIPTPFGINLSFSIFGVCLAGFYLGFKQGFLATLTYIFLGAIGIPVFSQFSGGFSVLCGISGGFIWGFLITSVLCGITKSKKNKPIKILLCFLAVISCHLAGVIQYSIVSGNNLWVSFLTASFPFLIKDIIVVFLADFIAKKVKIK